MIRGLVAVDRAESVKPFEPIMRQRVLEKMSRAAAHRIALIVAPAGYGKSVAVRQFLEYANIRYLRFSLRSEHATLLGFARGLAETLQPVAPGAVKSVAEAYERAATCSNTVLDLAIWASAHIREFDGTIVIDDFHEATHPDVSSFLTEIVKRTQESTKWIIATREVMTLPLASWLAYDLTDVPIDETDLMLTAEEAGGLAKSLGIAIREEDLTELRTLTEGWPVAFAFALRSATRTDDFKRVAAMSSEMVYNYLAEQIFRKLRDDERQFLLETCVFPTIDVEVLSRNGYPQARAMIDELRRHTAFISRETTGNDNERERIYRYHELFRHFLLATLEERGVEERQRCQLVAARVYEQSGAIAQALELYTQTEARECTLRLLVQHGFQLLDIGRLELVRDGLASLTDAQRHETPMAMALRATLEHSAARFDSSDACYEEALHLADGDLEIKGRILQRYVQVLMTRMKQQRGMELLQAYDPEKAPDAKMRASMLAMLAYGYAYTGQWDQGSALMEKALALVATLDDLYLQGSVLHVAAFQSFVRGEHEKAEAYEQRVIEIAKKQGFDNLAGRAFTVLGAIAEARADVERRFWASQEINLHAERTGERGLAFYSLTEMYEIEVNRGAIDRLPALEKKLSQFDPTIFVRTSYSLSPSRALQAGWGGDFASALRMLRGTAGELPTGSLRAQRWAEIGLYAVAAGERGEAEAAVDCVYGEFKGIERRGEVPSYHAIHARIWLALVQILLGRMSSGNKTLQQLEGEMKSYTPATKSLVKAIRALYIQVETGEGHKEVATALEQLKAASLGGYARMFEELPYTPQSEGSLFGKLTKTELAILQALAEGSTSKSIGEGMSRSALTIDTHVKSIVRKLGCKGRREAVLLARKQGIV